MIHQRHRQTDRRTDRQTSDSKTALKLNILLPGYPSLWLHTAVGICPQAVVTAHSAHIFSGRLHISEARIPKTNDRNCLFRMHAHSLLLYSNIFFPNVLAPGNRERNFPHVIHCARISIHTLSGWILLRPVLDWQVFASRCRKMHFFLSQPYFYFRFLFSVQWRSHHWLQCTGALCGGLPGSQHPLGHFSQGTRGRQTRFPWTDPSNHWV